MSARELSDDSGTTLVEIMVASGIMSIFLAMFGSAIVLLYKTEHRVEALTTTSTSLDTAFSTLDKSVRYASSISAPLSDSVGPYVVYLTSATGTTTCTQVRIDTSAQQLQMRSWKASDPPGTTWTPLASAVSSTTTPFVLTSPSAGTTLQQLQVQLTASSTRDALTSSSSVTFTALNSAAAFTTASAGSTVPSDACSAAVRS